jgi:tetratricopeptide (TPR) repeat protein
MGRTRVLALVVGTAWLWTSAALEGRATGGPVTQDQGRGTQDRGTRNPGTNVLQPDTVESLRQRANDLFYSHEHEAAAALLRRAVALAPDDPATHRSLAGTLWLQLLFKRGALTVDHYLGSFSKAKVELQEPPAELDAEFRKHVARAIELAEQRAAARPRDPQAYYDLGAAVGLRASYIATVEGKLVSGFKAARRAYDAHEKVMELDPLRKDAGLIVGTYRYIVSTLSLPIRLMAYVVGFGGGRERGIRMLEETAAAGGDNRTDALFALILVYNREKRYDDALRVLQELRRLYPRNRLVLLEEGSTALRAGRFEQAQAALSKGLGMLPDDESRRIPGEEALWRYKRGAALVALKQADAALVDLRSATGPSAQTWVHGRARVELARLAIQKGDLATAETEARQARTLCEKGHDPTCVNAATELLRAAHGR